VGIVASIAFEAEHDTQLRAIDAGALFGINLTRLACGGGRGEAWRRRPSYFLV
jgi:LysR family cys regulon transcriptional activator